MPAVGTFFHAFTRLNIYQEDNADCCVRGNTASIALSTNGWAKPCDYGCNTTCACGSRWYKSTHTSKGNTVQYMLRSPCTYRAYRAKLEEMFMFLKSHSQAGSDMIRTSAKVVRSRRSYKLKSSRPSLHLFPRYTAHTCWQTIA